VNVDGSASADPDGTIAAYAWNFGDNTTGTGAKTSHTYAKAGTYTIALTVTDNDGATATTSKPVTVTVTDGGGDGGGGGNGDGGNGGDGGGGGQPAAAAADTFARTVASGWGTANQGGAWTATSTTSLSVAGGTGSIVLARAATESRVQLAGVSLRDTDVQATFGFPKLATGGSLYGHVATRASGWGQEYRGKLIVTTSGSVVAEIDRVIGGTETYLTSVSVAGLTVKAGDKVNLRFQAQGAGTTTLRMKAWKAGTTEPANWPLTKTDTTAQLQSAGAVGIGAYLSSAATNAPVTISVSAYSATAM
jgi:PKD repeat protein